MAAPIKADGILLDLDGTLWDAVEGICRGWNAGFAACGLEPNLTVPQLRACMGLLMEDIAALDRGESLFFSHYDPEVVGWLAGLGK